MEMLAGFLHLVGIIVIVDAILSWVQTDTSRMPRAFTSQITAPLYAPVRRILNPSRTGGLDFSPLVVLIVIMAIRALLLSAATPG